MVDHRERRFSIDPGKGRKMDGCPYSVYEDGRDVKDYIIPPDGYVFRGFLFDPEASNQIYDGKLIAQYDKEPLNNILKSNLWKFLLPVIIIAVIAAIVLLAVSVFKDPKPTTPSKSPQTIEVPNIVEEPQTHVEIVEATKPVEKAVPTENVTSTEAVEASATEAPAENVEIVETVKTPVPTVTPAPVNDTVKQFHYEFWGLIHQRESKMETYIALYEKYRKKVSGEEYNYLRLTILKDFASFKTWSGKLKKIPAAQLESTKTIKDLKQRIKEIP